MEKIRSLIRPFIIPALLALLFSTGSCDKIKETFGINGDSSAETRVDSYPLFSQCVDVHNKLLQKKCFQDAIHTYYKTHLEAMEFNAPDSLHEKIYLHIEIDTDNTARLLDMEASDALKKAFPQLPDTLRYITSELQLISPAKVGRTPVATRYRLPVIFTSR